MCRSLFVVGSCILAPALTSTAQAQEPKPYRIVDLGLINLGDEYFDAQSRALAINNKGEVAGASEVNINGWNYEHAFVWLPNSAGSLQVEAYPGLLPNMYDLTQDSDSTTSVAHDINDWGHVVGGRSAGGPTAFLWLGDDFEDLANITRQQLHTLPGTPATAYGVLNRVDPWRIIGAGPNPGQSSHAAYWEAENNTVGTPAFLDFPFPEPPHDSWYNSAGYAVTYEQPSPGVDIYRHAGIFTNSIWSLQVACPAASVRGPAAWDENGPWNLDDDSYGNSFGAAEDVSLYGEYVGWSKDALDPEDPLVDASCLSRALYWATASMGEPDNLHEATLVGSSPPESFATTEATEAYAIRNGSVLEIVGAEMINERAVIWRSDGQAGWEFEYLDDLYERDPVPANNCFIKLVRAHDINDDGWIVGVGLVSESPDVLHAFLLVPTTAWNDCPEDLVPPAGVEQQDLNAVLNRFGDKCTDDDTRGVILWEDLDGKNGVDQQDLIAVLNRWADPACEPEQVSGVGGRVAGSAEFINFWATLGGAEMLASGQITAAQVAEALNQPSQEATVTALLSLLSGSAPE